MIFMKKQFYAFLTMDTMLFCLYKIEGCKEQLFY